MEDSTLTTLDRVCLGGILSHISTVPEVVWHGDVLRLKLIPGVFGIPAPVPFLDESYPIL